MVDYRIARGQDMSYKLQGSTKNSILGVSPLSNRTMFISYHQPSFLYGTESMNLNQVDIERLEVKYRKTLKCMLSLPDCAVSAAVYLCIGVLPAEAQRDVEILGLLGQLAMCDQEAQNIRAIIEHTLTFYGVNFSGWSGLVRRTCLFYSLPDPLLYLEHPWRADRWRNHCKKVVIDYWGKKLISIVEETPSLEYIDTSVASLSIPMRGWQLAGLSSAKVREATIVNWMLMGTYFTRELQFKMKKSDSPFCLGCGNGTIENLTHFILHCQYYNQIREDYLPKLILLNNQIGEIISSDYTMILLILDPLSSKLPEKFVQNWSSANKAYELSRSFCFNMHEKREKLTKECEKLKTR
jgi:hypothetical protein